VEHDPVIIISVRDAERDIVELLNAGADDYVAKPFYTNELIARIEAVHRRRMPEREPIFRSGRLEVDAERREARVAGDLVRLTPTEYAVLDILVRYSGRIVTRERLLKEVWGPAGEAEEGSLRVYINALRKKIEGRSLRACPHRHRGRSRLQAGGAAPGNPAHGLSYCAIPRNTDKGRDTVNIVVSSTWPMSSPIFSRGRRMRLIDHDLRFGFAAR